MVRKIIIIPQSIFLVAAVCFLTSFAKAATVTAGSAYPAESPCSQPNVQAAVDNAQDGDTVLVPAGTCTWDTQVLIARGITITGAGCDVDEFERPIRCRTIIKENVDNKEALFRLETEAGKSYRLMNFEFQDGSGREKENTGSGVVQVVGESESIRIDHNKWDRLKKRHVRTGGYVRGVADHNTHLSIGEQIYQIWHDGWAGGTLGDSSWSEEIDWGGPEVWYIENNHMEGVDGKLAPCTDTYSGARFVFRNNNLFNAYLASHGTGDGAGRHRGLRQFEVYGNTITYDPPTAHVVFHVRGGTGIYFNNIHNDTFKSLTLHYYRINGNRADGGKFGAPDGLNAFDINDPGGFIYSGVAGPGSGENILVVPGAAWNLDEWGYIVRVPNSSIHPRGFFATGVVEHTDDTIVVGDPNFPENDPHIFVEGEAFEIRRILLGLDQTGAGTTDLLIDKSENPTPVNLNQKFDPVYFWGNTLNGVKEVSGDSAVTEDVHYMKQVSNFNGTTGMGMGPLAGRPIKPTLIRTAYFATDVGEQGTLFVWDGVKWVYRWAPFVFPHPLVSGIPYVPSNYEFGNDEVGNVRLPVFKNVFNPFQEKLLADLHANGATSVSVTVNTRRRELIKTIFNSSMEDGASRSIEWDGRNEKGIVVSSGVYLLIVKTNSDVLVKKIVVIK